MHGQDSNLEYIISQLARAMRRLKSSLIE